MQTVKYKVKCQRCGEFILNTQAIMGYDTRRCKDIEVCNENIQRKKRF